MDFFPRNIFLKKNFCLLRNRILFLFLIFPTFTKAQLGVPYFQSDKRFGGSANDQLYSLKIINETKILMGGFSYSPADGDKSSISKGNADYWVVMTDSSGKNKIWEKTYGGNESDELYVMEKTMDGSFILGGASLSGNNGDKTDSSRGGYDYWIVKIDSNGTILWQKTFGGNNDDVLKTILPTFDGGYLLGGYSNSDSSSEKTDSSKGSYDFWIVKIDPSGNLLWNKTFGGVNEDLMFCGSQTLDSGFVVGGFSNSGVGGDKTEINKGDYDFWIIKLDSIGNKQWEKGFGGTGTEHLYSIKQLSNKQYMLFGESNSSSGGDKSENSRGDYDFWTLKLDSTGNKLWDRTHGGNKADNLTFMFEPIESNFLLGGFSASDASFEKTNDSKGGFDYWIIKIDTTGNKLWDENYGGPDDDFLYSIDQSCTRGLVLGGWSQSGIGGDKTEETRGDDDYWIVKLTVPIGGYFTYDKVCNGATTNFLGAANTLTENWNWNFGDPLSGDANSADIQNPIHTYTNEGIYTVTAIVTAGCQKRDTIIEEVEVIHNPILGEVNLGNDREICIGETITLNPGDGIPENSTYVWSPNGETTKTITINKAGTYRITVSNGTCSISDRIFIDDCSLLYVPNAITQNKDGKNEIFYAYGVGILEFNMKIFNRWGQLLYESDDINVGWNTIYENYPSKDEVYIWHIFYKGLSDISHERYGTVSVIR